MRRAHYCAVGQPDAMIEDVDGVLVARSAAAPQKGRQTRMDGCVVPTSSLADVLGTFIEKIGRNTVVALPGSRASGGHKAAPAIEWLAERTRRHDPTGKGVHPAAIERIMSERGRERGRLTPLRTADVLLTTIGVAPFVYYDGTLEIRKNPDPRAARAACCAGSHSAAMQSLTGALGFQ